MHASTQAEQKLSDLGQTVRENLPPMRMPQMASTEPQVPQTIPAFTRRREIFAGRLAMIGFPAACFSEYMFADHPNIMQQVAAFAQSAGLPVGVPQVAALLAVLVGYNAIAALASSSPTWSDTNQAVNAIK
jgi:hypothetical protein